MVQNAFDLKITHLVTHELIALSNDLSVRFPLVPSTDADRTGKETFRITVGLVIEKCYLHYLLGS